MTYLLDVNALLAFRYAKHMHYTRVRHWLERQEVNERGALRLATCAITELGFVRVATGPACLVPQMEHACADLMRLKRDRRFAFLGDAISAESLPAWVTKSKHTTDGHLLQLSRGLGRNPRHPGHRNPRCALDPRASERCQRSPRAETSLQRRRLSAATGCNLPAPARSDTH